MKSLDPETRRDAQMPRTTVSNRYTMTEASNNSYAENMPAKIAATLDGTRKQMDERAPKMKIPRNPG
jgi:hypothetical protein